MDRRKKRTAKLAFYFKATVIGLTSFSVLFLSFLIYLFVILPEYLRVKEAELEIELPETGVGDYRVFVTSGTYSGDLGGLSGADTICQNLADNAGLVGSWVAWVSTDTVNARDRIRNAPYFFVDSTTQICADLNDLTDGTILHAIWKQENGSDLPLPPPGPPPLPEDYAVWTGTALDGTSAGGGNCNNWTNLLSDVSGAIGQWNDPEGGWTNDTAGALSCDGEYRLYCFEYLKDRDGDGYFEDADCDDNNAAIHPGAAEVCNNLDDNCNGQIDENLVRDCGSDVGECRTGREICVIGTWGRCIGEIVPVDERCDNRDNDCDGAIDEDLTRECGTNIGICTKGVERCAAGTWSNCSGVQPQTEVCDGLDNNCDGQIDEGCSCDSGTTQQCGSDIGECSIGTQWCEGGMWGPCLGGRMPASEICDGKDNDCDGKVDENLSKSCGSDIGTCKAGVQYCTGGVWGDCTGKVDPASEECDELDNDCDGTVDEGCGCVLGEVRGCGIDAGECQKGNQKCEEGVWSECEGCTEPSDEVCDEKDNDCDGEVDEGYVCEEEAAEETGRVVAEEEKEKGEGISEILGEIQVGRVLFVILIASVVILIAGLGVKKYLEVRQLRAVRKFKEKETLIRKRKGGESPLG